MALPTVPSYWHSRNRGLEQQIVRQREQEARLRHQWQLHCQYFKQHDVRSSKQAQWSSRQSFQQSMSAYHRERLKEEKRKSLEERRKRLQQILQEEGDLLEAELKSLSLDQDSQMKEIKEKSEELKSAREERRKKLAEEMLYEHWKKNAAELRQIESDLHKKHVVNSWGTQLTEKQQQEAAEQEEKRRFENEYETARREALERMKREEERKKQEEKERAQILRQQMEELSLREVEAKKLKKEQAILMKQQWELEELEEERKKLEERRKKSELGRFLSRQYKAQLKRRAEQIQEELNIDRQILEALLEKEGEDQRLRSARREQAIADVAWMKRVIEEQLQLEREREAEFDTIFREEAKRVWEKREAEWERERQARERLMQEVLTGRQVQIQERIEANRQAQEESLQRREELIQELEAVKQMTHREREEEEGIKTARKQELETQISARRHQEWEALHRRQEEEEEERQAQHHYKEKLTQEAQLMTQRGYEDKGRAAQPHMLPFSFLDSPPQAEDPSRAPSLLAFPPPLPPPPMLAPPTPTPPMAIASAASEYASRWCWRREDPDSLASEVESVASMMRLSLRHPE
nr:PREDICTED: trichoplein keratin filament-binding protein isoform X2 [Latimeria chalumnae]|eukprot:XP_014345958.1 PREDICTED: trichoplein keratin filament-binding protein isoform X2 [Latimeria chalumnae]